MALSPKKGPLFYSIDGEERYGTGSTERRARGENVNKTEVQQFDHSSTAVTSPNSTPSLPVSPPPLYGKKAGPLTKQEMEENRQFGGDDYILANQSRKSNEEVKRANEEMICEFKTMAKERPNELRMKPIVFANTDSAIALVGKSGCRLGFSDGSAYLDIPAEALAEYQIIYLYKLPEHTNVTGPADQRKIYSYSGLITCGPEDTHFNKDVTLNFEHCAALDNNRDSLGHVRLAVLRRENETTPWIKQEQTRFRVKANRVEHHLREFSQRCYGLEEDNEANSSRLRMCLMLAVSRVRRHYVEAVLMRDEISLINAHRDNFIDARGFEPNEVHVIRSVFIDPTQHVRFEGTGFRENGPNDWNLRGYYPFIMRTAIVGRVELSLQQTRWQTPIAAISITVQGDIEIDMDATSLQVDEQCFPYIHSPTQVQEYFGRRRIQCPPFALPFTGRYNMQTFDGNAPSREREPKPPVLSSRFESAKSCPHPPGDGPEASAAEEGSSYVRGPSVCSNAERYSMQSEQSVEEGTRGQPEEAENLPCTNEERIALGVATDVHSPGAEESPQSVDVLDDPQPSYGDPCQEDSLQQADLELPRRDRVARRRQISTSSLRSDDGEILDAAEAEIREHSAAVSGGDNESLTTGMRSRRGSSASRKDDGNESGQC